MKNTLLLLISALIFSSCRTFVSIPNYVSSKELASLTIGSSKAVVKSNLGNTNPYDILAGWSQGCEVHHYKYKQAKLECAPSEANLASGLNVGRKLYGANEGNAYLIYKNGKLSSLVTDIGKAELVDLMKDVTKMTDVCSEKGLRGCTDPASLNYNEDAIIADTTCEYCPCDFIKNPDYNKNRPVSTCNTKCIPVPKPKVEEDKKECTKCDIIERLSTGKAGVNVNLNLPADN